MLYTEVFVPPYHRPDSEDVAVIFTDGKSNTDVKFLPEYAQIAKEHGIKIFAVGVGM